MYYEDNLNKCQEHRGESKECGKGGICAEIVLWIAGLSFLLNFFWEMWHGIFLYVPHWGGTENYVPLITRAAIGDAFYIVLIFVLGALMWRSTGWFAPMTTRAALFIAGTGIAIAIAIEVRAVYVFDQWSYNEAMPTLWGLGVSPLIQLAVTGALTFLLVGRIIRKSS